MMVGRRSLWRGSVLLTSGLIVRNYTDIPEQLQERSARQTLRIQKLNDVPVHRSTEPFLKPPASSSARSAQPHRPEDPR
jgi:hypothetical protein